MQSALEPSAVAAVRYVTEINLNQKKREEICREPWIACMRQRSAQLTHKKKTNVCARDIVETKTECKMFWVLGRHRTTEEQKKKTFSEMKWENDTLNQHEMIHTTCYFQSFSGLHHTI